MKGYKTIVLTIAIVVGAIMSVHAQRDANTMSAKAAYGLSGPMKTVKYKPEKARKKAHKAKTARVKKNKPKQKGLAFRRRNVWAG